MYLDIPKVHRCCGCVPARYGLLFWIYIRLMLSISLLALYIMLLIFSHVQVTDAILPLLISGLMLVDVIMNIVALVGGHSKNPKLLQAYYRYSFVAILIYLVFYILIFYVCMICDDLMRKNDPYVWIYLEWYFVVGVAGVGIQVYMLLLLKSKLSKLNENGQFQFVNNAADAECTMDIEEPVWDSPDPTIDELKKNGGTAEIKSL